jgi:hypothetical protein
MGVVHSFAHLFLNLPTDNTQSLATHTRQTHAQVSSNILQTKRCLSKIAHSRAHHVTRHERSQPPDRTLDRRGPVFNLPTPGGHQKVYSAPNTPEWTIAGQSFLASGIRVIESKGGWRQLSPAHAESCERQLRPGIAAVAVGLP